MLIRFRINNFLSFGEEQEFSMIKSRVRKHPDHVCKTKPSQPDILRTGVIFGANAAGKSNLVEGMSFCRNLIIGKSFTKQSIVVPIFKLNERSDPRSSFIFEILVKGNCYEYGFVILNGKIEKEWLYKVSRNATQKVYERDKGKILYLKSIRNGYRSIYNNLSLELKDQQLLLTVINQKKEEVVLQELLDVYGWFKNGVTILKPDSKYIFIQSQMREDIEFREFTTELIKEFDTGIEGFSFTKLSLMDNKVNIPEVVKKDLEENMEKHQIAIHNNSGELFFIYLNESNELIAEELTVNHKKNRSNEKINFHLSEESDGTLRILHLLPALYILSRKNSVVFIDEIGRSLHSLIPLKLLKLFYETCQNNNNQLIFTTHEMMLLDLNTLRRDEIWFVAKDMNQQSCLYSLEEFKERYDKELLTDYLDGRYNAIPIL